MMQAAISQSVLPLNADGSVYHLCLRPEDIAKTIILVGDPERVPKVSRHFSSIEVTKHNREFVTHTGTLSGQRISVVSTGIGTSNIDIVLNELDALHNIDLKTRRIKADITTLDIIRLGTCGALQEHIEPDALLVSRYAAGFDGGLCFYNQPIEAHIQSFYAAVQAQFSRLPMRDNIYVAAASTDWLQHFSSLGEKGITLTCPGFYAAQHRELRLPIMQEDIFELGQSLEFNNYRVLNFEMETAMILGLGGMLGHRCASVSAAVYNRVTEAASVDPSKAVERMIEQALQAVVS